MSVGPGGDVYVQHTDLQQINQTMANASTTLNSYIANLMSQVETAMSGWAGVGATAANNYMVQYQADQRQMNTSLNNMAAMVQSADNAYATQDADVGSAFGTGGGGATR